MRKILIGTLLLIVFLVGIAVALPFFLPREMIKAEVERRVSAELGRAFTIEGPLTFRPWRPFALTLGDVRLANPDWAEQPNLARVARVELEVDALAYLDGTIALERLVIEQPVLALERREDGTPSWQLGSGEAGHAEGGADGGAGPGDIRIGEVRVSGGSVSLDDRSSGETRQFEEIELWARGDPASPGLLVDGSVLGGGERATLSAAIGDLNGLFAGEPSSVSLEADLPGVGLVADGEASPAGSALLAIDLEATPRRLMDWLGQPLPLPNGAFETVQLTVDVAAAPSGLGLKALNLAVDELALQGDLELVLGARPALSGSLDLGAVDLGPYLPPAEAADEVADEAAAVDEAPAGWPEEPLDLPLPLPLDIDLALAFDSLATPEIALGAGRLRLTADASASAVEIQELALYDGSMTGLVSLTAADAIGLDVTLEAADVQLLPLLEATAEIDRLTGTGHLRLAATSEGRSVDELVRNLAGDGSVFARDGAIIGINIAATIRQLTTLGAVDAASQPRRTDFAEAGGSFIIEGGVLDNQDFALLAPVLRISGAGTVDLGEQTLSYRLQPNIATTLEGQDARQHGAFHAGVPLLVEGPWADPSIRLDIGGDLSRNILDPGALGEVVRGITGDPAELDALRDTLGIHPESPVGGALQGLNRLLGERPAASGETPAPPGEAADDPVGQALDSLNRLFGR